MKGSHQMKIGKLTPQETDFDLLFELTQIISKNQDGAKCRIVDDTGIVNASFNSYVQKLDPGVLYHMTHLKTELSNGSLQIVMSKDTSITKEPDTLGFKDKTNDMSKKKFNQQTNSKSDSKSLTPVLNDGPKKEETLIPFTPQQAQQQLRQKKNFQKQMNTRRKTDFKPKQHYVNRQQNESHSKKYKQKGGQQVKNNDKSFPQDNQYGFKPKYKEKAPHYQQKQKKEYREKGQQSNQRNKTKSLMYKPKE